MMHVSDLVGKSRNRELLTRDERIYLLELAPDSAEAYRIMAEARCISKELTGNRAEVHAQPALDLAPCPCNCAFYSSERPNFQQLLKNTPNFRSWEWKYFP